MRFSLLAAAVILCSLGYCIGDELPPCNDYPGKLHIFLRTTITGSSDQELWIKGSSGRVPSGKQAYSDANGKLIVELKRISVYDCVEAFKAAYGVLQEYAAENGYSTEIKDYRCFSLVLPLHVHILAFTQVVDQIKDAVALWTNYRWERVCTKKPGYVYILWESIATQDATHGSGWVYTIKGSSGQPPLYAIQRLRDEDQPATELEEKLRIPVNDCVVPIVSLVSALEEYSKIEHRAYAFSVPLTKTKTFFNTVKNETFPLLSKIPHANWMPCEENREGILYVMRISSIEPHSGEEKYICDNMFSSSMRINDERLELGCASFKYSEIDRYAVLDCANAFRNATVAVNETFSGGWWRTRMLDNEECYEMIHPRSSLWFFKAIIWRAIFEAGLVNS